MKAKDLMTRDVIAVDPLLEAEAAARMLTEKRISGAAVVDQFGALLGAVSQTDLARHRSRKPPEGWDAEELSSCETPVIALMSAPPVTCDEDDDLETAARLMTERKIHRLFVTKDGRLTGVLSSMDVVRAVAGPGGR